MAILINPVERVWRTDFRMGRNVYALLSNDTSKASKDDQLIGTMESSFIAQNVVDTHNAALLKYGRHYMRALMVND